MSKKASEHQFRENVFKPTCDFKPYDYLNVHDVIK